MTSEEGKWEEGTEESKGDLNTFEWDIANFKVAFENASDGASWISPFFAAKSVDLPNTFWRIRAWTKVNGGEFVNQKQLGFSLVFCKELNAHNPVVKAKCEFSLLDRNQKEVSTLKSENVYEYGAECFSCGFPTLATITELTDPNKHYLDDNVLRIRFKVWIQNSGTNAPASKKPYTDKLHKNLLHLLDSSKFSDIEIVTQDSTMKAHKSILACRSPVFEAMFQNEMTESLTNTVKIEDFSSKTVKRMLQYIYSGSVESVDEDFIELLKIAEKYELEELKLACSKAAIMKISVENVIELLILGDMYNDPELKCRAMAFINSNKANPMFSREIQHGAFEKLAKGHPMLLLEMYRSLRNNDVDAHHSGKANETIEEVARFTTND